MQTHTSTKWSSWTEESTYSRGSYDNDKRQETTEIVLCRVTNAGVYLMNRCTTSGVHAVAPHEKLLWKKLDLSDIWIFSSMAYVHILNEKQKRLNPKLEKCIFAGYSLEQKGYKCYKPSILKVRVSWDVVFEWTREHPDFNPIRPGLGQIRDKRRRSTWTHIQRKIDNELTHSLDSEFKCPDLPII